MGAAGRWVAAVEELPPDHRGFRRVLRLHAVELVDGRPAVRGACGYEPHPSELRPERRWDTVTVSGRCALCTQRLRRPPERRDIVDVTGPDDNEADRRLRVVPDPVGRKRGPAGR